MVHFRLSSCSEERVRVKADPADPCPACCLTSHSPSHFRAPAVYTGLSQCRECAVLAGSAPSWRIKVKSIHPGDVPWLGPTFWALSLFPSVPILHPLHLLPSLPAACCLPGWADSSPPTSVPTLAPPTPGLLPAAGVGSKPPTTCTYPLCSQSLRHGLQPLTPRAAAPLPNISP
jgi:hypothetical protein